MHCHEVDLPERDKLAAGKGLVSDVFMYYPKGIIFPIFVNDDMKMVMMRPNPIGGYNLSLTEPSIIKTIMSGTRIELFASVVDRARDYAVRNETGEFMGNRQLQPV